MDKQYQEAQKILMQGGLVVMPSDTVYGIFARAFDADAVEKLYKVRKRESGKSCIVLIADMEQLDKFYVHLSRESKEKLESLWSNRSSLRAKNQVLKQFDESYSGNIETHAVSVILACDASKITHICRGRQDIAIRIPSTRTKRGRALRELLKKTGPLLAPSANLAGEKPARTIRDAKKYFGKDVSHYISYGKKLEARPSHAISFVTKKIKVLR